MIWNPCSDDLLLLILNQPVDQDLLLKFVKKSRFTICADGGANRLPDGIVPDAICGDFDSITMETRTRFSMVKQIKIDDQDTTDLQKCISVLLETKLKLPLYIMGSLSGRLDHILHAMHVLYSCPFQTILVSNESLAFLLSKGSHQIYSPPKPLACGLVPFNRAKVSTTGLVWNLDNHELKFGEFISTSNILDGTRVELDGKIVHFTSVETDDYCLWTVESCFE